MWKQDSFLTTSEPILNVGSKFFGSFNLLMHFHFTHRYNSGSLQNFFFWKYLVQFEKFPNEVSHLNSLSFVSRCIFSLLTVRLKFFQFRPNFWEELFLIQTSQNCDTLINRMFYSEVFDGNLEIFIFLSF